MKHGFAIRSAFGALAMGALVFTSAAPALAKLSDPGQGSVIGGGFFRGLPLGPQAAAPTQGRVEASEVAGETCYLVPSRVANERGEVSVRLARVCE